MEPAAKNSFKWNDDDDDDDDDDTNNNININGVIMKYADGLMVLS